MNDAITAKNYKKLSLQVSHDGLSYCSFDTLNREITAYNNTRFDKFRPLEAELQKVFDEHKGLTAPYDEIVVLHDNSFNTFVPNALFDAEYLGSYLQYNTKVFDTDVFAFDALGNYELNNVYVPLMNVNNFLIDRYGSFEYKNANSVLVARVLDASKNIDEKQVYVHVQENHFEIIIVRNQKLLLFNSFEYKTPEDFLYYLLFTMEQLMLNPETVKVHVLGRIKESDPVFGVAYTYIRHVQLYEPSAGERWSRENAEALEHFILFNS